MNETGISTRNLGCAVAASIVSSTLLGGGSSTGGDYWIALAGAAVAAVPLMLIYGRIAALRPGTEFFDAIPQTFGKIAGSIAIALLSWYALHVGAMVASAFSDFVVTISLPRTPDIVIMLAMLAVAAYLAGRPPSDIGRWSLIVCTAVLSTLLFTLAMSVRTLDFRNLLPLFTHSAAQIASDGVGIGVIAFGETVFALMLAGQLKEGGKPSRAYIGGLLAGGLALLLAALRNLLVLGPEMLEASVYPAYMAARVLRVGDFLEHAESVISFNLVLLGITKLALCLKMAAAGIARLTGARGDKRLLLPVALLALALGSITSGGFADVEEFLPVSRYYTLPFTVLLPIALWIASEIKIRKEHREASGPPPSP